MTVTPEQPHEVEYMGRRFVLNAEVAYGNMSVSSHLRTLALSLLAWSSGTGLGLL